ncbi:MAG: iron-containing alcohol dehydrogenase [Clostridia bacterium]|nr:iron-containing alcohol dehydrogenase [Clostridia bacterium]
MDNFLYETPTKVYFGKEQHKEVGRIIKAYGAKKVLIHYGGKSAMQSGLLNCVKECLAAENIAYICLGGVVPNPELSLVREGIALCLAENVDFILAVGGGSVLDSAKGIANGAANPTMDVWDFSIRKAEPQKTIPKGCILTLAAAGSEMSASCVITNTETGMKCGYNSICNRMNFAILNPELTYTVSPYQTACGIVDIAMHTMERYFSVGTDTYLTDSIAEAVIKSVYKSGQDCLKAPTNYAARANMMWASSLAHNGLTECGRNVVMAVHQLEHEVSAMYPAVAHGAGLAALWGSWARFAYPANKPRFVQYAKNIWGIDNASEDAAIQEAIAKQEKLYQSIGMPISLRELGVKPEDLETLANKCSRDKTRVLTGYCKIGYAEMLDIYKRAY